MRYRLEVLATIMAIGQAAAAATLNVSVADAQGAGVPNLAVQVTIAVSLPRPHDETVSCGSTSLAGRVSCTGLPAGNAKLSLIRPDGFEIIGLQMLQDLGPLAMTLTDAVPAQQIALTLPPGEWLTVEPQGTFDASTYVALSFMSTTAQAVGNASLLPVRRVALLMPPGTWEFRAHAAGASLGMVFLDGSPLPPEQALVTIVSGSGRHHMTLQLDPPTRLSGTVRANPIPEGTELQLVDLRSTNARPRSVKVAATGNYMIDLEPGAWRITLTTACEQAVLPAAVDVELRGGEQKRIDLELDASNCAVTETAVLEVNVNSPDEQKLGSGWMLLYSIDAEEKRTKRDRAFVMGDKSLSRRFETVPLGEYVVELETDVICPTEGTIRLAEAGKTYSLTLAAKRGATVRVTTKLPEGQTVPLRVKLTPPKAQRAAFDWDHPSSTGKRIKLDAAGNGEASGVLPGEYDVNAIIDGAPHLNYVAKVRLDRNTLVSSTRLELGDGKVVPLQLEVVPAARIAARLVCLDGGKLPYESAYLWQLSGDRLPPGSVIALSELPREEAPFVSVALSGDNADQILVPQLDPRRSQIAIAVQGMSRAIYPPGTEDPSLAQAVELRADKLHDLGVLALDCRPALRFALKPDPSRASIDLRLGEWTAESSVKEGEWVTVKEVDSRQDSAELRGLPETTASVRLSLRHPYLLPAAPLNWTITSIPFTRGKTDPRAFELKPSQLGGAIARPADVAALRLKLGAGEWVVSDGLNLVAGHYQVQVCADTACQQVVARWDAIEVKTGETTKLPNVDR